MSGYCATINGVVHDFETAEERDEFLGVLDTCVFVKDEKNEFADYWFCHCSECGYKTNTALSEGNELREAWNFYPCCGRTVIQ